MTDNRKFVFVSVGRYGWDGHYATVDSCSSKVQGYGEPDYSRAEDGALVLDTRTAKGRSDFVKNVLAAPLVRVDLEESEVDKCPQPSEMLKAGIAGNTFGALLDQHLATPAEAQYGSLDSISPKAYCDWWKERGARAGIVENGEVRWYDEHKV